MTKACTFRKEGNMIFKKVILMVLLLAMVPFVMGPGACLVGGGGASSVADWKIWSGGVQQSLGAGLDLFYNGQMDNITTTVNGVNAWAAWGALQSQDERPWGEEVQP